MSNVTTKRNDDLRLPPFEGRTPDKSRVRFSGSLEYDLAEPAGRGLARALHAGSRVYAVVELDVKGVHHNTVAHGEDDEDLVRVHAVKVVDGAFYEPAQSDAVQDATELMRDLKIVAAETAGVPELFGMKATE